MNQSQPNPETVPKSEPGPIDLRSSEEKILHAIRNYTEVQRNYGLSRDKGKFVIVDRAKLERIFQKQPGLKSVLRRLWTENEPVVKAPPGLTRNVEPLPTHSSDKSPYRGTYESQEGTDRGTSQGVDRT